MTLQAIDLRAIVVLARNEKGMLEPRARISLITTQPVHVKDAPDGAVVETQWHSLEETFDVDLKSLPYWAERLNALSAEAEDLMAMVPDNAVHA